MELLVYGAFVSYLFLFKKGVFMDLTPSSSIVPMTKKTSFFLMSFSKVGLKKVSMLDLSLYYQGVAKFEVSTMDGVSFDPNTAYILSFQAVEKIASKDEFETVFTLEMDAVDKECLLKNRDFQKELTTLFTKGLKNASIE